MKIETIDVYYVELPLKYPWRTARNRKEPVRAITYYIAVRDLIGSQVAKLRRPNPDHVFTKQTSEDPPDSL